MKQNIVIYGASGLGREIFWLIKSKLLDLYNIIAFIDDGLSSEPNPVVSGLPVYSKDFLLKYKESLGVVIAIADPNIKKKLYEEISIVDNLYFPSIVSPDSMIAQDSVIGAGTILIGSSISVDVKVGKCVLLNGPVSLGHDVIIGDYVSIMPRCSISGNVTIGDNVSVGAHSFILQSKIIGENSVIAPGSMVFTNIQPNVTVMGNPAMILMRH